MYFATRLPTGKFKERAKNEIYVGSLEASGIGLVTGYFWKPTCPIGTNHLIDLFLLNNLLTLKTVLVCNLKVSFDLVML
jgi:hypothetical protein